MFKRRLRALGYLEWDKADLNDQQHFRKVTVWLEDQKIRYYKIEDRQLLREIGNDNWPISFQRYCSDVGCPESYSQLEKLGWLVGHAVWLELGDNCEKYQNVANDKIQNKNEAVVPNVKSTNPLDNLDFDNNEFKEGTNSVAKLLRVPRHPNHLITLEASSKLVRSRLNADNLKSANSINPRGKPFPVMDIAPGFGLKDSGLENSAKGLALLYIHDLRELQTKINETIVAVQTITANPKTDTKLGKVGK